MSAIRDDVVRNTLRRCEAEIQLHSGGTIKRAIMVVLI